MHPESQPPRRRPPLCLSARRWSASRLSGLSVIATLILSFYDRSGNEFVGLANYRWAFFDAGFRQSIFNNILWLAVVPAACTFFGLVIAS